MIERKITMTIKDWIEVGFLASWIVCLIGVGVMSHLHFKNKKAENYRLAALHAMQKWVAFYDKEDLDSIAFTTDINEIPVELRHKDGAFRLTVKQTVLSEANRAKATKASLTVGNVPKQMYLKGSTEWENDEVTCTGTQEYTKEFGIDLLTDDEVLEIHSLPQEEGISCTVKLYDEAGNVYCENSFTPEAGVKIHPNMISKVTLDAKGFEFDIQLEDDAWDGPND